MTECPNCRQVVDAHGSICRRCGMALTGAAASGWSRRPMLSPEQAAGYWRNFFRPFFTMAFLFFGAFFLFSLIMVAVWFFMFRR